MYLFKISKQSISTIVIEVCQVLNEALKDQVQMPTTIEGWLQSAQEFEKQWNYPHCLASMDGKHVMLQAPINSGSEYYNYKSFFSIVLFALVDANYNFLFADVGSQGRISDGEIFKNSVLWEKIQENSLCLLKAKALPGREKHVPYVMLGDEAFTLHENVMKPYSGVYELKGQKKEYSTTAYQGHGV
nr:uncharacterized protein LOC111418655 [Onthophagus taurus]